MLDPSRCCEHAALTHCAVMTVRNEHMETSTTLLSLLHSAGWGRSE